MVSRHPAVALDRRSLMISTGTVAGAVALGYWLNPRPDGLLVLADPTAEELALRTVLASERALIRAYDSAIADGGFDAPTRSLLRECRADHEQHVGIVGGRVPFPDDDTASRGGQSPPSIRALRTLEVTAAEQRQRVGTGLEASQARRTLALIGASEHSHAEALGRLP